MSILEEQLIIGDKVVSNDIGLDPVARSLTMCNGYYVNYMYPNNTTIMTGENPFNDIDSIATSKTAGQIG